MVYINGIMSKCNNFSFKLYITSIYLAGILRVSIVMPTLPDSSNV